MIGPLPNPGEVYDEVFDPNGAARGHWGGLVRHLENITTDEMASRWNEGRRILRNHGVTYNVSSRGGTNERPWELDPVPFIVDAQEWKTIERGVIQRAHLQNRILQDIYTGPQYLLRNGLIPPPLLFANPNFLRCCRGVRPRNNVFLHLHAVDLARSPDGCWWVLDDRIQMPSGVGYALENRTIVGRILQDVFHDVGVRRLTRFMDNFRDSLINSANSSGNWPRVVLLTPGQHSPAYYEHALLARHLGFTLVEGADLCVRDNRVFMKTVEGLQRVDVIVRRVNDAFCDPVELRQDSFLGTPGLVQAARSGQVQIANALGAGMVETPALQASFPEICRYLLSEDLQLPVAPTWWCGNASERRHVLDRLDQIIIKSAFPTDRRTTTSGAELNDRERKALQANILQNPQEFIGQEPIRLSMAPTWVEDRIRNRPIVLRVYVASNGDSYEVMPGGLTKVASSSLTPVKGLQLAGGSKDTWVTGGQAPIRGLPPIVLETRPAQRLQSGVPSRIADGFFWLGRYTERLENLLRILKATASRIQTAGEPRTPQQVLLLLDLLDQFGVPTTLEAGNPEESATERVLEVSYAENLTGSVRDLCERTTMIVSVLRDRFSGEAWNVLNSFRDYPGQQSPFLPINELLAMIQRLILQLAALTGLESENMSRGHEWNFREIGRRIERGQHLCTLLPASLRHSESPELMLNPLLEICDSSMTYRRIHYSVPEPDSVLQALMLDPYNPRSLRFNLDRLGELVARLPDVSNRGGQRLNPRQVQDLLGRLESLTGVRDLQAAALHPDSQGQVLLESINQDLSRISDSIAECYFNLIKFKTSHEFRSVPTAP